MATFYPFTGTPIVQLVDANTNKYLSGGFATDPTTEFLEEVIAPGTPQEQANTEFQLVASNTPDYFYIYTVGSGQWLVVVTDNTSPNFGQVTWINTSPFDASLTDNSMFKFALSFVTTSVINHPLYYLYSFVTGQGDLHNTGSKLVMSVPLLVDPNQVPLSVIVVNSGANSPINNNGHCHSHATGFGITSTRLPAWVWVVLVIAIIFFIVLVLFIARGLYLRYTAPPPTFIYEQVPPAIPRTFVAQGIMMAPQPQQTVMVPQQPVVYTQPPQPVVYVQGPPQPVYVPAPPQQVAQPLPQPESQTTITVAPTQPALNQTSPPPAPPIIVQSEAYGVPGGQIGPSETGGRTWMNYAGYRQGGAGMNFPTQNGLSSTAQLQQIQQRQQQQWQMQMQQRQHQQQQPQMFSEQQMAQNQRAAFMNRQQQSFPPLMRFGGGNGSNGGNGMMPNPFAVPVANNNNNNHNQTTAPWTRTMAPTNGHSQPAMMRGGSSSILAR
jgi:hypothetical protein